jgi:hypothetical protein
MIIKNTMKKTESEYEYSSSDEEVVEKEIPLDIFGDIQYLLHQYCVEHNLPFFNIPSYKITPLLP